MVDWNFIHNINTFVHNSTHNLGTLTHNLTHNHVYELHVHIDQQIGTNWDHNPIKYSTAKTLSMLQSLFPQLTLNIITAGTRYSLEFVNNILISQLVWAQTVHKYTYKHSFLHIGYLFTNTDVPEHSSNHFVRKNSHTHILLRHSYTILHTLNHYISLTYIYIFTGPSDGIRPKVTHN